MEKFIAAVLGLVLLMSTGLVTTVSASDSGYSVTAVNYGRQMIRASFSYTLTTHDYSGDILLQFVWGDSSSHYTDSAIDDGLALDIRRITVEPNTEYSIVYNFVGAPEPNFITYTAYLKAGDNDQVYNDAVFSVKQISIYSVSIVNTATKKEAPQVVLSRDDIANAAPSPSPVPSPTPAPAAPPAPAALTPAKAAPTSSTCLVNGSPVAFGAYNIDGYNYFKLRDLAYTLKDTSCMFNLDYDSGTNTISITNWQPYIPTGGELSATDGAVKTANPTTSKVLLDGKEIHLTAYNIGGNNYFKLRDICDALNISVNYDAATNTILID